MSEKLRTAIEENELSDMRHQRDYWFAVANNYIDFVDWICDTKMPGWDTSELLKEFNELQEKEDA